MKNKYEIEKRKRNKIPGRRKRWRSSMSTMATMATATWHCSSRSARQREFDERAEAPHDEDSAHPFYTVIDLLYGAHDAHQVVDLASSSASMLPQCDLAEHRSRRGQHVRRGREQRHDRVVIALLMICVASRVSSCTTNAIHVKLLSTAIPA